MLIGAAKLLREAFLTVGVVSRQIHELHPDYPVGQLEGGLHGFGDPLFRGCFYHHPIHDHIHVVFAFLVEHRGFGERVELSVDPNPRVAISDELPESFLELAFATTHDGREHLKTRTLSQPHQPVDDLLRALPADDGATHRAVRDADAGEQETQVVVDLRDGANRGSWVPRGGLLINGDRG